MAKGLVNGIRTSRDLSIWISSATIVLMYRYLAAVIFFRKTAAREGEL